MKFGFDWLSGFKVEKVRKNIEGRRTDDDDEFRLNFKLIAAFCSRELNQKNNDPANTHLIFGPTLCTKTSFAKFDIVLKWVKVNTGSSFI